MFKSLTRINDRTSIAKRLVGSYALRHKLASTHPQAPEMRRKSIPSRTHGSPRITWPTNLLDDAYKTGLTNLTSSRATEFLTKFVQLASTGTPSASAVQPLLRDFEADSRTLFWLGWILQKAISNDPTIGSIAKLLHTTSAALQDEYASLILVESALRAKRPNHPEISEAVNTLTAMSSRGNVFAKERLAVLRELQGDQVQALSLSEEVLTSEPTSSATQLPILDPRFSAWKTVARLRHRSKDPNPIDAVEYGAKVLDDADAYFELAMRSRDSQSQQKLDYMLKSAASGDARAALMVGDWYFERATGGLPRSAASKNFNSIDRATSWATPTNFSLSIASEWYELALKLPKHSLDSIKEAAGDGIVITLHALKDARRCNAIASEHLEMQWAKKLLSDPAQLTNLSSKP